MSDGTDTLENPAAENPMDAEISEAFAALGKNTDASPVQTKEPSRTSPQTYDFRNPSLLSPRTLCKLRTHQEEFVSALEARLSLLLRLELSLKLAGIQTVSYKNWMRGWANPSCLTLFKLEPLRGVCVLEIPPRLGLSLVDRLLGGPGDAPETCQEISEIERALLEQTVQIILSEWSRNWTKVKDLKPVLLGYESNGDYIQIAPDLTMFVLSIETTFRDCTEKFQIGIPFASIEPLIAELSGGTEPVIAPVVAAPAPAPLQWKSCFDEVPVPVTVERDGLELTAREILNLKIGDLLPLDPQTAERVNIRLGDTVKFHARLGTIDQRWAVEITQAVKS